MNTKIAKKDVFVYESAKQFLLGLKEHGVTSGLLKSYLSVPKKKRPSSINGIHGLFFYMISSSQNADRKTKVIGHAIGGLKRLKGVLGNFRPDFVIKKYNSWESLLDEIERKLKPSGKMRRKKASLWPQFCLSILSAAEYMRQMRSAADFYNWVDSHTKDAESRIVIAEEISRRVHGLGFALSCDFLKKIGYDDIYSKPDVHVKEIFKALRLCPRDAGGQDVFKAVNRVADNARVTPYAVDKLIWLIGSGNFYNHKNSVGKNGRIGNHKKEFIDYARAEMKKKRRK